MYRLCTLDVASLLFQHESKLYSVGSVFEKTARKGNHRSRDLFFSNSVCSFFCLETVEKVGWTSALSASESSRTQRLFN